MAEAFSSQQTEEQEQLIEPTKAQSGCIRAIAKDTVHKICSGQVVLSLAVAVKELVENAIDAGATLIEVKLRDQGLEALEVSDNGSGVEASNLEGMTAKYHTSKIREFVDLEGVETFGFRGEALSSLCALADMSIVTRHRSTDVGIKVELDHDGKIRKRTPAARSIGTTVALTNLFATLPVRKRDFTRNIRKEFTKMCHMLQAYCLVACGVRIICSNQSPRGAKTVVLQTHGAQDVRANIAAVFGSRQATDIVPLKPPFEDESRSVETQSSLLAAGEKSQTDDTQIDDDSAQITRAEAEQFKMEGFVSSCSHGAGRSARDRQYFYVNSRPCDPKNIAKVINDVYHRYNVQQFPFVFLNVLTPRSEVDVNLTPDKRQLLINNERILLHVIKRSLLNTFGNIPATFKIQNASVASMLQAETKTESTLPCAEDSMEDDGVPITSTQRYANALTQLKQTGDTLGTTNSAPAKRKCSDEIAVRTLKLQKIQSFLTQDVVVDRSSMNKIHDNGFGYKSEPDSEEEEQKTETTETQPSLNVSVFNINKLQAQSAEYDALTLKTPSKSPTATSTIIELVVCKLQTPSTKQKLLSFIEQKPNAIENTNKLINTKQDSYDNNGHNDNDDDDDDDDDSALLSMANSQNAKTIQLDDSASENESTAASNYTCAEIRTSLAALELSVHAEENLVQEKRTKAKLERLRFKSEINPSQNQNAEAELQKEIAKESFAHMEILGQFNLGFIIVRLDADLFIVDQHATDEKYNFEMLQRSTVLQQQPLAVPQTLEMTAVNEMVLLDHLPLFEKNGFKFEINESAPPTRKVRLLGKPFSKKWEFGKDDIDELIFMLQDAPEGTVCRPSRIRAMFASRACRKSVMIGQALTRATMKKLITHMGEIEQPWNCPHGRPTMRHLINTAMLQDEDDVTTNNDDTEADN